MQKCTFNSPVVRSLNKTVFAHTWSNRYLRMMKQSAKAENTLELNSLMRSMAWGNCQIILCSSQTSTRGLWWPCS